MDNPLLVAAMEVQDFCSQRGWKFCLIGGLAIHCWGRPRTTRDVDFSILTSFGCEDAYVDAMFGQFRGRIANAREFAVQNRVLLAFATNDVPFDAALAGLPFEERMIARASEQFYAPGVKLITASPEDLIVMKAFASRKIDWFDVEGILIKQQGKLDWAIIRAELAPLCELKESPEIVDELERLKAQLDPD